MFRLALEEKNELVTNCDRLTNLRHSATLPFAFTENGVAMLSDEERQRLVAGFANATDERVKKPLDALIEAAKESGINLADLQAELRMNWNPANRRIEQGI